MWHTREYEQCNFCVMDTSDPLIRFDESGQCNHCTAYLERVTQLVYRGAQSDQELEAMAEMVRKAGRGRDYDCVIGVSGGVDSSYVAHVAKNIMGLRPLAVHMDNGWNSEEAVKNIKAVCRKLGIDYTSYVLDWEEFRDIQLAFLRASIVEMEIPTDAAIPGCLHRVAAKHGIKFILSGGNLATEAILPRSWFYYPKDARLLRGICRKFGLKIRNFPTFDYIQESYFKFVKGIKILYPLNHVPYSKADAINLLVEKLDWVKYGEKHHESKFTKFVLNYIQPVKFGVDYRRATLSSQICTGEITREQALLELEKLPYDPNVIEEEKEYVAKKFGLSLEAFEEIMALPCKVYSDYPNNEKLLGLLYRTYRNLFGSNRSYALASYDQDH